MEDIRLRELAITAVAPLAWGTTYLTTDELLPPDRPLFSAALRALPAGLVLLLACRRLPHGAWWWKAALLGLCNIGLFFPLLFLGAYHLPGGLAATTQAASPLAVMALAFVVLRERATWTRVVAALVGLAGVGLLVLRSPDGVTALGLVGAFGSVLVSGLGFVMVKRWPRPDGVSMLTLVSWQLVVGGVVLLPLALVVEGPAPSIDLPALGGYLWLGTAGTILAYCCWFHGLGRMPAGAVSLVGLLNPVTGTALGVAVAGEAFGWSQAVGMALVLGGVAAGVLAGARRTPPVPVETLAADDVRERALAR